MAYMYLIQYNDISIAMWATAGNYKRVHVLKLKSYIDKLTHTQANKRESIEVVSHSPCPNYTSCSQF